MKSRSYSGCIKAAYNLMSNNIAAIIRHTWLPAILLALFTAIGSLTGLPYKSLSDFGMQHPMATAILFGFAYILMFCASIWLTANTYTLLNGKSQKSNLFRSCMLTGVQIIILAVVFFITGFGKGFIASFLISSKATSAAHALQASYLGTGAILILLFIFCIPFVFSATKYIADHNTQISDIFRKDYKRGLKHWGYIFTTCILASLILLVICIVMMTPAIIIITASSLNQLGMLNGDPDGTPGGLFALLFITLWISCILESYIIVYINILSYYIYGSIEQHEIEKQNKNK